MLDFLFNPVKEYVDQWYIGFCRISIALPTNPKDRPTITLIGDVKYNQLTRSVRLIYKDGRIKMMHMIGTRNGARFSYYGNYGGQTVRKWHEPDCRGRGPTTRTVFANEKEVLDAIAEEINNAI